MGLLHLSLEITGVSARARARILALAATCFFSAPEGASADSRAAMLP